MTGEQIMIDHVECEVGRVEIEVKCGDYLNTRTLTLAIDGRASQAGDKVEVWSARYCFEQWLEAGQRLGFLEINGEFVPHVRIKELSTRFVKHKTTHRMRSAESEGKKR